MAPRALRLIPPAEEWLTAEQVAAALGMNVYTVHRLRKHGKLTGRLHGSRTYRYSRQAIDAFKRGQVTEPPTEYVSKRDVAAMFRRFADLLEGHPLDVFDPALSAFDPRAQERGR